MICVTGAERTVDQLGRRLAAHERYPLQEVRLDLLDRIGEELYPLLARPDLVVTCRGKLEGGGFAGSDAERLRILQRALDQRPGYLDLEVSFSAELRQQLYRRRGQTRIILSWHGSAPLSPAAGPPRGLGDEPADLLKIAAPVDDAADLADLRRLEASSPRPVLRIGMGAAGVISRALYRRFGSPWTYVIADGSRPVAPGQLTTGQAARWRVEQAEALAPIALVGGEQVLSSPGPRVYNTLFARHDLPYIYLPVVTRRPVETLALLETLGFGGCSVTMPAKQALAGAATRLEPPADRLAAVNTVLFDGGATIGLNTDVAAIRELLEPAKGATALVLGAGGAAAAAVAALAELGCPTRVTSRDAIRAEFLARRLGGDVVPWESRAGVPFEILVNATPCGSDGSSDPMPETIDWSDRWVLDAVIAKTATPLLQRVVAAGGRAIDGLAWWLRQGRLQMEALTSHRFELPEMQRANDAGADQDPTAGAPATSRG